MKNKTFSFALFCCLLCSLSFDTQAQTRDKDPVVVQGSQISAFQNLLPSDIVGFRYTSNGWEQVPIQIDERVLKDVAAPYDGQGCTSPSNFPIAWDYLYYADPNTGVGSDTNPNFDADDELVFMQFDTGIRFTGTDCPANVETNSIFELAVQDPINNAITGYLYLFEQDGTLDQAAGKDYVDYNFSLSSGQPLSNYPICENNTECPNGGQTGQCENTTLSTSEYEVGVSSRWVEDVLRIKSGNSTQMDILDRHQGFIAPGFCNRTEETFSRGRGPIVNSIDGPVRAIRTVMGSNSGTFNQLTALFTKYRTEYSLDFRVHNFSGALCAGFVDAFDFDTQATGMTYFNDKYPAGVPIDGSADLLTNVALSDWDLVSGPHGSIAATFTFDTDIPIAPTAVVCNSGNSGSVSVESYYDDSGTGTIDTCRGNTAAFGTFGFRLYSDVCTDRRYGRNCSNNPFFFIENRTHYYLAPATTTTEAQTYSDFVKNPLIVNAQLLSGNCETTPGNLNVVLSPTAVSCAGGSDGSISTTVTNGSGSYSYLWSNGQTQANLQNVGAGTYSVTVTDNNTSATATASATVTEPSSLTLTVNGTNETNGGGNGTASATAAGGTPPYTYAWTGPGGFSSSQMDLQGLSAGTYTVVVTDANGCSVSGSVTLINETTSCTYSTVDFEDFETSWGIWNDGGSNSARIFTGTSNGYAIRLRNGTSSSNTFTDLLDLSIYQEIRISFDYGTRSMESGKSFELQLSTNGGSTYSTLQSWTSGVDFAPDDQQTEQLVYSGSLSSNARLRFVNNGSQNNDWVIVDNIRIEGCGGPGFSSKISVSTHTAQNNPFQVGGIQNLRFAPNPVKNEAVLSFQLKGQTQAVEMRIIDALGRVVWRQQQLQTEGWNKELLELGRLSNGLYWLHLQTSDGQQHSIKFIKRSML